MANLQLLLKSVLILIITVFSNGQLELPETYQFKDENAPNPFPMHYDIELILQNIENTSVPYFNVSGNVFITFKIIKPTISFKINLSPSINILTSNLVVQDSGRSFSKTIKRYTNELSSYEEWVFETELQPETYILELKYKNVAHNNEKGFFRFSYKMPKFHTEDNSIQWLVATNSQPNGASRIFPCFELPNARATFNISVTAGNQYQVLTNTEAEHHIFLNGLQRQNFIISQRIAAHQVAILIYNFNYINEMRTTQDKIYSRTSKMHIYYTKVVIENIIFHLRNKWADIKEKFVPIINYALIPGFPYDSADGWRLAFLREGKAVYNNELDTYGHKITMTKFVAQKVTHQWLGNIISLPNWSNLWVNDGIAIFYGMDVINKIFPDMQIYNLFVVQDIHEALRMDSDSFMQPLHKEVTSEIDTFFYFIRYLKAPALMHMLYYMTSMDYDVFKNGVESYLFDTYDKVPTIDDFWKKIQHVHDLYPDGMFINKTVKTIMDTWMENNYPIIRIAIIIDDNEEIQVKIRRQRSSHRSDWHTWWILITWFTDEFLSYSDRISPELSKWISPDDELRLLTTLDNMNNWVIVNTKRCGYYRVSYNQDNWERILWFLESNAKRIHVLNRAQLIDDAYYFLVTDEDHFLMRPGTFKKLITFLSKDTDYIAWYPMFKALESMSSIFVFNNTKIWNFKVHLLGLLVPVLDQIGYDAKPNENKLTECLREEAAKWACVLGNHYCKTKASEKLEWHLKDRVENKLLPGWKKWVYCDGLKLADSLVWHQVLHVWDKNRDDELLEYLMCTEDYYIAINSINATIDKSIIEHGQPKDKTIQFMFFLAKCSNHSIIIEEIFEKHLIYDKPRSITEVTALSIIINHIYITDGFKEVENYANRKPELSKMILSKVEKRKSQILSVKKFAGNFIGWY